LALNRPLTAVCRELVVDRGNLVAKAWLDHILSLVGDILLSVVVEVLFLVIVVGNLLLPVVLVG